MGILKRLRGAPIARHDAEWQMVYNPHPPYEILQNKLLDFATLQNLRRFARYWDLVGNSGNFLETARLIRSRVGPVSRSPFHSFMQWTQWLHARVGRTDGIALVRLMKLLFDYLAGELKLDPRTVAESMWRDYQRGGRRDRPGFLNDHLPVLPLRPPPPSPRPLVPKRQARHRAAQA